jgi:drug/metabolite transporter (DMT)-like permease
MAVGIAAISFSPILVRVAALPALALAFWRCAAGAALLAPFARRAQLGRAEAARLLAAGVFLAVHFGLWNASLALTSVAASTTLVSCSPLFVGLGGRLLGEPPSRRAWLGIALAVAGAAVIGLGDAARMEVGSWVTRSPSPARRRWPATCCSAGRRGGGCRCRPTPPRCTGSRPRCCCRPAC